MDQGPKCKSENRKAFRQSIGGYLHVSNMLSERSLTQKITYCIIPKQAKLIHSGKNQNSDFLRAEGWGEERRWVSSGN